jgi:hypothetical protein
MRTRGRIARMAVGDLLQPARNLNFQHRTPPLLPLSRPPNEKNKQNVKTAAGLFRINKIESFTSAYNKLIHLIRTACIFIIIQ